MSPILPHTAQFVILTYNEHSKLDAASLFESAPDEAWTKAAKLAKFTNSSKFQLYSAQQGERGAVTFSRIEKPRK